MSENYEIKMKNILGDYYLCIGAYYNCLKLYRQRDEFIIKENDSEEIKKIKEAQMNDLLSNLGKVGEKALKYIIALQKVKIAPNEDLKSLESIYRGDNAMKHFAKQLGINIEDAEIQEIFNYKDYNNQKAHNFDYLLLIIEKLMPEQYSNIRSYILYNIQSQLLKKAIKDKKISKSFEFIRALILPNDVIKFGFATNYDGGKELPKSKQIKLKDYKKYGDIIKQSGDIFTRLRYYSNNPKDKNFNLDDVFQVISYFVHYIMIIHENNDNLDIDISESFALESSLKNKSLLYLSEEEIIEIFSLSIDLGTKIKLLFQSKEVKEFGCKLNGHGVYSTENVKQLIQLNLSSDDISDIIEANLQPRFVEYCLSNNIRFVAQMQDIYERYLSGENLSTIFHKIKR